MLSLLDGKSSRALRIRADWPPRPITGRAPTPPRWQARSAEDPVALAEALSLAHHCLLGPG